MVALLNALHIRQFNRYYDEVKKIVASHHSNKLALENAAKAKPRLLVCAPSNAAVDNVIMKIMEDGFVDGHGRRYNPSMVRSAFFVAIRERRRMISLSLGLFTPLNICYLS